MRRIGLVAYSRTCSRPNDFLRSMLSTGMGFLKGVLALYARGSPATSIALLAPFCVKRNFNPIPVRALATNCVRLVALTFLMVLRSLTPAAVHPLLALPSSLTRVISHLALL